MSSTICSGSVTTSTHDPGDSCSLLVSLPLIVPYGLVVKSDGSASAAYIFSSQFPSARVLLSRSSGVGTCDMFVGQLQVDLVSFTCKRAQVSQIASVFNRMARKKLQQRFDKPIYIRCEGLRQRSVTPTSVGSLQATHDAFIGNSQQRVYLTTVHVLTSEDREKFWAIESFVESYVEKLKELRLLNSKTVARTPDLFVVVRRFMNDPLPQPLSHYDQYACDGVQLSEMRLVFSKGTSQCPVKHVKIDPRFRSVEVSCRPIVCDVEGMEHILAEFSVLNQFALGRPARYEFAPPTLPAVFPGAAAATAYLESLSLEDDREVTRALLETDSHSSNEEIPGGSDRDKIEYDEGDHR